MYALFLFLHSWLRWIAIVAGIGATAAAFTSRRGKNPRGGPWGLVFTIVLDVQLLVGLALYFLVSPNMQEVRAHFGEAMKVGQLRFWAVEHPTAMVVAIVLAHVARVLGRRATTADPRRLPQVLCFGLSTLVMLIGIPWPGLSYGRPLIRP